MNIVNFTINKNGMEEEYQKTLGQELDLIRANGRTKESLNDRYNELRLRQQRYLEEIQNMMISISLTEKALAEISTNWNNKEYWKDE